MKKFPFYRQLSSNECGPTCLKMILAFYGKKCSLKNISLLCDPDHLGVSIKTLLKASEKLGFKSKALKLDLETMQRMPLPAILFWNQSHFIVIYKVNSEKGIYSIADPEFGKMDIDERTLLANWIGSDTPVNTKGIVLLFEKNKDFKNNYISNTNPYQKLYFFVINTIINYKWKFLFTFIIMLIALFLNWTIPILFQRIIDDGIKIKNTSLIKLLVLGQAIAAIGYVLFITFYEYLILKINFKVSTKLLKNYLEDISQLPLLFFLRRISSDLLQRINDLEVLQIFITRHSTKFIITIANFIVFIGLLFSYKLEIGSIYILSTIMIITWSTLFLKKRAIIDYSRFTTVSEYKNSYFELVAGMPDIKINNASKNRVQKLVDLLHRTNVLLLRTLNVENYQLLGSEIISGLRNIVVIGLSSIWVVNNKLTLGEMISINYILGQLNGSISFFSNFLRDYQDAQLALNRTEEVTLENKEQNPRKLKQTDFCNKISFRNVNFKYSSSQDKYILKNLNIDFLKGKMTAIVGNSGSGKTTIIKLLLGFYPVNSGEIFLDDKNFKDLSIDSWRNKCGTVLQDGYIFRGTIIENIALHDSHPDMEKIKKASQIACIHGYIESLPMEYHTLIGKGGVLLSGGEKQRILIARAAYKNPEILIMDEATNSLDANNESLITSNFSNFFLNKTVVVVAHRLNTIKQADQIIVLNNGKIVEKGTHDELLKNSSYYYELFRNQINYEKSSKPVKLNGKNNSSTLFNGKTLSKSKLDLDYSIIKH